MPEPWLEHFVDRGVIIGAHSAAQRRSRARFSEKTCFPKNVCRRGVETSHSSYTMAAELAAVIAKDDLVIFSYGGCPYCRRVTRALDAAGIPYNEVDYDDLDDGDAVRSAIRATHRHSSVPAVFVKGKFVGGCNDGPEPWMGILPSLNDGKLAQWLRDGAPEA